jgi:hypothetical protein
MPLAPPPFVDAAEPVSRRPDEPRIFWPSVRFYGDNGGPDSSVFPSINAIKARCGARPPEPLEAFLEAVWDAQDRIFVADDYLFKPLEGQSQQDRYGQILDWLPDGLVANEIRFLTNAHPDQDALRKQFNERVAEINQRAPRRLGIATIDIRFTLGSAFPYVHDRFAIIDNELWHFGATVGGLHSLVNATSRGWDAHAREAVRFFDEAWNGDADVNGGRHG